VYGELSTHHTVAIVNSNVIVALVSGVFLVTAAVIGFFASRSEPRRAKELLALNTIIQGLDDSETRQALVRKRERIAKAYSTSDSPPDRSLVLVLLLLASSGLLITPEAFTGGPPFWKLLLSIFSFVMEFTGAILLLVALAAMIVILVGNMRGHLTKLRGRREQSQTSAAMQQSPESGLDAPHLAAESAEHSQPQPGIAARP
jgi:hypothetical protein